MPGLGCKMGPGALLAPCPSCVWNWGWGRGVKAGLCVWAGTAALGLAKRRAGHCGAISAPSTIPTLHSWGQASLPVPGKVSFSPCHPSHSSVGPGECELFLQLSQLCLCWC